MIKGSVIYNTNSTVREIIPALSLFMGVLLAFSFVGFLVVAMYHGALPYTNLVKSSFAASLIFFVLAGVYWKGLWTFWLERKADEMAKRHDYFEINEDEMEDLRHYTCESTGEIIEFRGISGIYSERFGRLFVHFDNEQDRVLFRLGER